MGTGSIKRVIISRTDSIGDVMLTLPMCVWLKDRFPEITIIFLVRKYTRDIVEHFDLVDEFLAWDDFLNVPKARAVEMIREQKADCIIHVFPNRDIARLAKKAGIPMRIGTSHRLFHFLTCTHPVNFTRKRSECHESQLNYELFRPLGLKEIPELSQMIRATRHLKVPDAKLPEPFNDLEHLAVLHPKSQGSAVEWPIENYMELAAKLAGEGKKVVFTGTEKEGTLYRDRIPALESVYDTTGKLTLKELMVLISRADNLVACSTGPLHIAGYYGVNTVGLFSMRRPIHPGRWKALGEKVTILVNDVNCPECSKGKECSCILNISVDSVMENMT